MSERDGNDAHLIDVLHDLHADDATLGHRFLAIVTWIETKYDRRRRQRALGKLTPVEFEMI